MKKVRAKRKSGPGIHRHGVLFLLICLFASIVALAYVSALKVRERGDDYREQNVRFGIAEEIAKTIQREIPERAGLDLLSLNLLARRFANLIPEIDIYLLDDAGLVRASLQQGDNLDRTQVALPPIKKLLDQGLSFTGPVYGDDPSDQGRQGIFSVAPLHRHDLNGFVYVILKNRFHRFATFPFVQNGDLSGSVQLVFLQLAAVFLLLYFIKSHLSRMFRRLSSSLHLLAPEIEKHAPTSSSSLDRWDYEQAIAAVIRDLASDRAKLEGRQRRTEDFISQVSHDLRSPLVLIDQITTGLLEVDTIERQSFRKSDAEIIRRNVESLRAVLSDLHGARDLSADTQPIERGLCQLDELASELLTIYKCLAESRRVSLTVKCDESLDPVLGSFALIERALRNLLENAIRHTPEDGRVELSITQTEECIRIQVSDTGSGIPEHELPFIFEPFRQVNRSDGLRGSSGLGLAIVERIIRAHESTVEVESKEGQGSRFSFTLPRVPFVAQSTAAS